MNTAVCALLREIRLRSILHFYHLVVCRRHQLYNNNMIYPGLTCFAVPLTLYYVQTTGFLGIVWSRRGSVPNIVRRLLKMSTSAIDSL